MILNDILAMFGYKWIQMNENEWNWTKMSKNERKWMKMKDFERLLKCVNVHVYSSLFRIVHERSQNDVVNVVRSNIKRYI